MGIKEALCANGLLIVGRQTVKSLGFPPPPPFFFKNLFLTCPFYLTCMTTPLCLRLLHVFKTSIKGLQYNFSCQQKFSSSDKLLPRTVL